MMGRNRNAGKPGAKNPGKTFKRIMAEIMGRYKPHCVAVVLCLIVSAVANVYGTMFMQRLIDDYITPMIGHPDPDFGPMGRAVLGVALVYLLGAFSAWLYNYLMIFVSQGTLKNLRVKLFSKMERLPIKYFDTHAHGDIMSVYTNDIDTMRQMISQSMPQLISSVVTIVSIVTSMIILNVPLFVLGWRFIGKDFLFSSVYATAVSSLMIDGLAAVHTFKPMEPILACLYGGVIIGVSCGIMLREGATTGGTELAARLLKLKLESLSIGTLCLAIDILVTVTYALIFRDLTRALYGMISLSLISVSIDKVVYGPNAAKVAYIISDCHEELTRRLLELDRGVTLLQGKGAYSGKDKQVILCACARTQIIPVKRAVQEIDPDAFVIVCDAHEILGEGFGVYAPGGL